MEVRYCNIESWLEMVSSYIYIYTCSEIFVDCPAPVDHRLVDAMRKMLRHVPQNLSGQKCTQLMLLLRYEDLPSPTGEDKNDQCASRRQQYWC